jgi:hypothetical protein
MEMENPTTTSPAEVQNSLQGKSACVIQYRTFVHRDEIGE